MKDILLIVLFLANIIQAIFHFIERRDMMNRIMSKDYKEYSHKGSPPPIHIPSAHSRILRKWRDRTGGE